MCTLCTIYIYKCWLIYLQAMAVAGMTAEGKHRSIDHPKVLRTPPESPRRVRASYHTPGEYSMLFITT